MQRETTCAIICFIIQNKYQKMSDKELENFFFKFWQLRKAGYTAHLDIDAYAG